MNIFTFFKLWGKGMKDYAGSPLGNLESVIIISFFIGFGCFVGAWQRHLSGDGTLAFILFAIGLLQLLGVWQAVKQHKNIRSSIMLLKNMRSDKNEEEE